MPRVTASIRSTLLFLAVLNAVCALAAWPTFGLATGAGKLYVISKYRELDKNGLINADAIKEYEGGRFAGDWRRIPDLLNEGAFLYSGIVMLLVIGVFVVNFICAAQAYIRARRADEDSLNRSSSTA